MSGQRTLSLATREFDPTDYARLVEIYSANYPDYPRSVGEWRSRDESLDRSKYHLQRYSFLENDVIVGFGAVSHVTDMFHPRKFWVEILVDPVSQGRGIGAAIYERLGGELKKLHELVQIISADMPSVASFTPTSYEQWEAFELKNPNLLPEGYMIAKDGSNYVGLSTVWRIDKEPRGLVQGNTGVRREYRGRGIAVALKLKVIDFARRNGYEKVKTWNASDNVPMLAVNTKLGFKREVGWITLEKNLPEKVRATVSGSVSHLRAVLDGVGARRNKSLRG